MTVTEPIATAAAAAPRPPGHALLPAVRRMLPDAAGRVALLPGAGPLTAAPHRRRAVRLLLEEATLAAGGQVFETAAGELLLLGAARAAAARVAAALARLDPGAPPPPEPWRLPGDADALLAWAETASLAPPAPPPGPAPPLPGLAELDARLAALPPERVLRRSAILLHAPGAAPILAARRLLLSRAALEAELGRTLAADPDLLRHAEDRLSARLPPLAGAGAEPPTLPLLLPLPLDAAPPPAPRPGLIGVLPLAAALPPGGGLAERRAGLAAAGWSLAIGGLDAGTLRLLPPAAMGADLLLLRWSPALDARASRAALRELPPPRLVLTGCDGPEALDWGRAAGLAHFAGPYVEGLLAATRMLACASAAGCTARLCADRAAGTGPEGRAGCRNPGLLAGMPPVPAA